jgi:hypothetical protein
MRVLSEKSALDRASGPYQKLLDNIALRAIFISLLR